MTTNVLVYFAAITIIFYIIQLLWKRRKFYYLSWRCSGPFALPVIGNGYKFICKDEDLFERLSDVCSEYESPLRIWMGPRLMLVLNSPEHAEKIMSSMKFSYKDENVYRFMKVYNGEGLISGSGPKWRQDRKYIFPLLNGKQIGPYFERMVYHSNYLITKLKPEINQKTFNIEHYLHRAAADMVNETIIGIKSHAQDGELDDLMHCISRIYVLVHARMVKFWLHSDWIYKLTNDYQEQLHGKPYVYNFMKKGLDMAREKRLQGNNNSIRTVVDGIVEILDEENPEWCTDEDIVHNLQTLYTASEDTLTTIASFTLIMLGMYPEYQKKVVEQMVNVMGPDEVELTEDHIKQLTWLDMSIKEVLRLFPIGPFIARQPLEDVQIDKMLIPEGCSILVPIYNLQRHPNHWEKPNSFYPEHFLPEAVRKRNPFTYMPFSAGPRNCLGKAYANLALRVVLTKILRNFTIEADGGIEDVKITADISVRIKGGYYPIRIKERNLYDYFKE